MAVRPVVVLAGGVGAARFLSGLVQVVPPEQLTVIVNTGDDRDFFGLRVCPDLDIITYTLAGRVQRETGWGLAGDTFHCLEALRRLRGDAWFQLGDQDLATHIQRSARLREGASLTEVTREITAAFGLELELLPMTEAEAPTRLLRRDREPSDFEEYLVRDGAPDDVEAVDLSAAAAAAPAPGVLEALAAAEILLICPSNPVVSIGTIRAVQGVEARLRERRDAVAVSPIIGGRPVKGPADRLLRAVGAEVSAQGVAKLYQPIAKAIVIDRVDAGLAPAIEALGLGVRVTETLMKDTRVCRQLADLTLKFAQGSE
ncbi:MAG: 2-phospho-L-lactate transferase [Deltaproteobacteria bacterium]|nr:MAG: 2-phospho-L-lactate transferase [Deltaproteobacteria bacterium]